MVAWKNDDELFALMRETLYSSVIGDILDKMNYLHQFLPWRIQPMRENMVVAGRAMTVLEADALETVSEGQNPIMRQSFGLMLEALDDLKKNEVYILGAAGAVVNGFHRDTNGILDLDFPCFSYGRYAQDQGPRGKVIDYRVPIDMEGVKINPGDIVFGDLDGVLVIPKEIEEEVIVRAVEKATGEKMVAEAIKNGMAAKASFDKYGIM